MPNTAAKKLEVKLRTGFLINTGFAIFELAAGIVSGSLALISDASHNFTDSLSLTVSYVAQRFARKKATPEHTYGYGKATIIAAFINSLILLLAALFIFYEAYQRVIHPQTVSGGWIMAVAGVGIAVNASVALLFIKDRYDLNIKSAFLNMAFDVLASVGALAAGLVIYLTGKTIADPIISAMIGIFLVVSSYRVMDEALHILLEGVPKALDVKEVEKLIKSDPRIRNVHDLHVWTIAANVTGLVCHIVPNEFDAIKNIQITKELKRNLRDRFNINHATIEVEAEECPPHEH